MLEKARKLLKKGLVVRARELLERAGTLPPEGRLLLAESCYRLRLNPRARTQAKKALPDARAQLLLGGLALDEADYAAAEKRFRAARESTRSKKLQARALSGLAVCMALQRLLVRARRLAREAMALAPKDSIVLRDVSFLKDEEGKRAQALKYARLAGSTVAGHLARARILAEEGRLDEARSELEGAKKRGPEEVDVFLSLAEVFEAKGEFLAAAEALRRSALLSPRGYHAPAALSAEVRLRLLGDDADGARKALGKTRGRERARLARAVSARRKSVLIERFPALKQLWDCCGPAVLAMLLKHWRLRTGQRKIALEVWDEGTPLYMMKSYARKCGLAAWSFRGDCRKLKALLTRGIPCVLDVLRDGEQHYLVALGHDGRLGEFILRDPSELVLLWMTERELRACWEPEGNWALVVAPRRMGGAVLEAGVEADEGMALAEEACRLFDRGRVKRALARARKAVRRGGGVLAARALHACLCAEGRWREAHKHAARVCEEFPRLGWAFAAEGEALWAMGRLKGAERRLRKARTPAARQSHAAVLFEMGRTAQAEGEVRHLLAAEPDSAAAHGLLGAILLKRGRHEPALDEYEKATELRPDDAHIRAGLGVALEKGGRLLRAEKALRRAVKLDGRDPWVLNQLAYFLAERERSLPEAVRLARKAVKLERGNRSYLQDTLGWALLKRGKLGEGLKWLRLAERKDDGTDPEGLAEVLYHIAAGLKKAGKAAQAAAKLRKAARLKGGGGVRAQGERGALVRIGKLHRWDVSPADAIRLQKGLVGRLRARPLGGETRLVAGADCAFSRRDELLVAGVVVFDRDEGRVVEEKTVEVHAEFPYVPGLLSFREGPGYVRAFEKLTERPDVVVFDGQGIAHMRGLGIAAHMGLILDLPTVGCAKSRLVGRHGPVGEEKGSLTPLRHSGRTVGAVVRTRTRVKPVYVSPGHLCDVPGAVGLILELSLRYRLPEPTRLAHGLVGRRKKELVG